jgi:hypothetical protein
VCVKWRRCIGAAPFLEEGGSATGVLITGECRWPSGDESSVRLQTDESKLYKKTKLTDVEGFFELSDLIGKLPLPGAGAPTDPERPQLAPLCAGAVSFDTRTRPCAGADRPAHDRRAQLNELREQAAAIANFTRQYGPRTSVIQRRLRSVYGFDDIEIDSHAAEITVAVKRHGVELRPVDYFSQSQQQTLLLGLFLTACSGQNWSSFAPVFLDDPVTHLDDLNTYALLDLIVGLLKSDFGNRQFIISTCDEKFFQLARQKFRYLNDGARFYRFRAVGEDGPVVEETLD